METEGLLKIQQELNAPKNQYNTFGKYKYRSCEDILAAVKPLLKETGCVLTLSDDIVSMGNRIYVTATATLTTSDGRQYVVKASAREDESKKGMDGAQITGAASSYARKYALNGLFCIDDVKDPDATNDHGNATQAQPQQQQNVASVGYTGADLTQALSELATVTTQQQFNELWNKWACTVPALCANGGEFWNACSKRIAEINQATKAS